MPLATITPARLYIAIFGIQPQMLYTYVEVLLWADQGVGQQ